MPKRLLAALLMLFACFAVLPGSFCEAADNPLLSPQDKIIAECTATVAADPNDYASYFRRGKAYFNKRLLDEAIADYSKAIEIKPDYTVAYLDRGWIQQGRKKYDLAIDDYTQAIKIDPSYGLAYNNRATCYNIKEQYDLAITDAIKAIELESKQSKGYINASFVLGNAYTMKHQYDDAIAAYRTLIANCDDTKAIENAKGKIRALGGTV
ncbi:MAG: tetratricopeptide repeat protein [Negativicutes bacterium]|nr:tetratricopeptide repeat protein [Negativicutes bacterium]